MNRRLASHVSRSVNRWQLALFAQLVISVTVWACFCGQQSHLDEANWVWAAIFFSALIWLCCVLGFWAGLGRARWRSWIIVPAAPLIGWISCPESDQIYEWELFCLGIVGVVTMTTTVLRQFCGRLVIGSTPAGKVDGLQFGIKRVLVWTSAAAVALGVGRVLVLQYDALGEMLDDVETTLQISGLVVGISTAVVVNIWAMLGSRVGTLKVLTVIGMTALAIFLNQRMLDHLMFAVATLIAQLLMLFTLITLRRQGYRFLKRAATPKTSPAT